jgi:hypothetical protein
MKWCVSIFRFHVWVGPGGKQQFDSSVISESDRHVERCDSFYCLLIKYDVVMINKRGQTSHLVVDRHAINTGKVDWRFTRSRRHCRICAA